MSDATTMNQAWWDQVTPQHTASRYYDVDGFLDGKSTLGKVERDPVGDNLTKADDSYFHRPAGALAVPLLLAFKAGW